MSSCWAELDACGYPFLARSAAEGSMAPLDPAGDTDTTAAIDSGR
jgi:hypothetical protein